MPGRVMMADSKGSRAQFSVEFLIVSGLVFILFVILINFYFERVESARAAQVALSAQRVADSLANAINAVERGGNGSRAVTEIPETLATGIAYNVSILGAGRRVEVAWNYSTGSPGSRTAVASLLTSSVNLFYVYKTNATGSTNITATYGSGGVVVAS